MTGHRPRRWPRRLALGFLVFALLLTLVWLFRFPLFGGLIRREIAAAFRSEGYEVEIGDLSGSLLTGAEATDIRLLDGPYLRGGEIERIRVSFSFLGPLLGGDDWLRMLEVQGVRAHLDLDKAPAPEPSGPDEGEAGPALFPAELRVSGLDLTVTRGERRLRIRGGRLRWDGDPRTSLEGSLGADELAVLGGSRSKLVREPRVLFSLQGDQLAVESLVANDHVYRDVLRLDLAALEENRVGLHLHLPLFDGELQADADLDLSGRGPAGEATVSIRSLDARALLRFFPDLPFRVGRIDGKATFHGVDPGGRPFLESLTADGEVRLSEAAYRGRRVVGLRMTGRLDAGTLRLGGSMENPAATWIGTLLLSGPATVVDARLRIERLDLASLDLGPTERPVGGVVRDVSATFHGPLYDPRMDLRARIEAPSFGDYSADSLLARAQGTRSRVRVEKLLLLRGPDELMVRGDLHLEEPIRFEGAKATLDIERLSRYREHLPSGLPDDLDGELHLTATADRGTPSAPRASFLLRAGGLRYGDHRARALMLEGRVETPGRASISEAVFEGEGPLPTVRLTGVAYRKTEAGPDLRIGSVRIQKHGLVLRSVGEARRAPDGTLGATFELAKGDLGALQADLLPDIDLGGRIEGGTLEIRGTPDEPVVDLAASASDLRLTPPGLAPIEAEEIRVSAHYEDGLADLRSLHLRGLDWAVSGDGTLRFDPGDLSTAARGDLSGRLEISSLPLALLGAVADLPLRSGTLRARCTVSGRLGHPVVGGFVEVRDGAIAPPGLPAVTELSFRATATGMTREAATVALERASARSLGAVLTVRGGALSRRGDIWTDPTLDLVVRGLEISRLAGALGTELPVRGRIETLGLRVTPGPEVGLELKGTQIAFRGQQGLRLDLAGRWREGEFLGSRGSLVRTDPATGAEKRLDLESCRLPFALELNPPAAGPIEDAPLTLRIRTHGLDLADLTPTLEEIRATGAVALFLTAGGTFDEPRVTGSARIENATLRLPSAPTLDSLRGEVVLELDPDRLVIRNLSGKLGDGDFRLAGTVLVPDRRVGGVDLALSAEDVLLVREEGLRLRSDLDLALRGAGLEELTLHGTATIRRLRYTEDVDYLEGGTSPPSLPLTKDPVLGAVGLDVTVIADEDTVRIRNNLLEADLAGRLRVGGTIAVPRPAGRLRFLAGEFKLPTVTMELEAATLDLLPDQPLRPFLDSRVRTRVSGYEIRALAHGPTDDLRIELQSTPALSRSNILSLLTTGVVWNEVDAKSLGSMAANVVFRQVTSGLSSSDEEPGTLAELANRVELDLETRSATLRILDWLYLRGSQDDPLNYGLDLIFRLALK